MGLTVRIPPMDPTAHILPTDLTAMGPIARTPTVPATHMDHTARTPTIPATLMGLTAAQTPGTVTAHIPMADPTAWSTNPLRIATTAAPRTILPVIRTIPIVRTHTAALIAHILTVDHTLTTAMALGRTHGRLRTIATTHIVHTLTVQAHHRAITTQAIPSPTTMERIPTVMAHPRAITTIPTWDLQATMDHPATIAIPAPTELKSLAERTLLSFTAAEA